MKSGVHADSVKIRNDEFIPPHEVDLVDIKFTVGKHIDREQNNKEYIHPFKVSDDGLVHMFLSQEPINYKDFPLNV
jgi:hypothetical protein